MRDRPIPEATVARLSLYLRVLIDLVAAGAVTISSESLAEGAGVTSAKVRKDLSFLGSYGTRGKGYDVAYLVHQIQRELGLTQPWPIAIVGVGNLGQALANFRGFGERGFRVAVLVDADPQKVGGRIGDVEVRPAKELAKLVAEHHVAIGVIATPANAAQEAADALIGAGVRSILNFAPAVLTVEPGVTVRKVDLAIELQILAYYEQRKAVVREVRRGRPATTSRS